MRNINRVRWLLFGIGLILIVYTSSRFLKGMIVATDNRPERVDEAPAIYYDLFNVNYRDDLLLEYSYFNKVREYCSVLSFKNSGVIFILEYKVGDLFSLDSIEVVKNTIRQTPWIPYITLKTKIAYLKYSAHVPPKVEHVSVISADGGKIVSSSENSRYIEAFTDGIGIDLNNSDAHELFLEPRLPSKHLRMGSTVAFIKKGRSLFVLVFNGEGFNKMDISKLLKN